MKSQFKRALVGLSAVALVAAAAGQGTAAVSSAGDPVTPREKATLQAGLQLGPKGSKPQTVVVDGKKAVMPNPYLANTPDATTNDWSYWRALMDAKGKQRAKSSGLAAAKNKAAGKALPSPLLYDELEPDALGGTNDSYLAAEPVAGFGTGAKQNPRLRILGTMPDLAPNEIGIAPGTEDNGAIPIATPTGIGEDKQAAITTAVLGDGPHGTTGDNTNDFDFYKLSATSPGLTLNVATAGSTDTIVAVYNAAGTLLAADDDGGPGLLSLLNFDLPATGDYYVLVAGYSDDGPLPEDPNDSGSGLGGAVKGEYQVTMSAALVDKDFYSVKLKKGDVLGGSVTGSAGRLVVHRTDGSQSIGSQQDASSLYPVTSPLPGGGNAVFAYVAEEAGWYAVSVEGGVGNYDATVEAYRPGTEVDTKQQTIFLDFDGARVNTSIFGDPTLGVRQLSPFSAFIARWGLPRSAENELINKITATVTENLKQDLVAKGLNPNVAIKVLNSRDNADPFGQANVSRIIVGGTIAESGINTIGIAQTIDPGNFGHEETALALMDVLSDPANGFGDPSINSYLTAASNKTKFIAQVIGNVVSHEAGHFVGSYHVDQFNPVYNLMDQGGNFPLLYGVGPDGIGGTADDVDVDFGEDTYNPGEGFTGVEDTLNNTAWAFSKPKG